MKARLSAVQQVLVLLPVASLTFAVLGRPSPENRRLAAALAEVTWFQGQFEQESAETTLQDAARSQGATSLTSVQKAAQGKGAKAVRVADGAPPIEPLTTVRIETVEDAYAYSQPGRTLTLGKPNTAALGAALAWRLAHTEKPGPFQLERVELTAAAVDQQDVDAEVEAAALQRERREAQTAVARATKKVEYEDRIFESRKKRKLPWKILVKSIEARKEARAVLEEKTAALAALEQRYQGAVQRAEREKNPEPLSSVPAYALAQVTLTYQGEALKLAIPVALDPLEVPVPSLAFRDFPETREAGLWEEIKKVRPAQAVAAVEAHFNWHQRSLEMAGVSLSGGLMLQLLPTGLPLLLWLLLRRLKDAGGSYSPFTTEVTGTLPRVGLKTRALELLALVILPCLSAASAATALLFVGQLPVLPALSAAACLVLGGSAFGKLGDLQELVASVVHSHSYPPPQAGSTSTPTP